MPLNTVELDPPSPKIKSRSKQVETMDSVSQYSPNIYDRVYVN